MVISGSWLSTGSQENLCGAEKTKTSSRAKIYHCLSISTKTLTLTFISFRHDHTERDYISRTSVVSVFFNKESSPRMVFRCVAVALWNWEAVSKPASEKKNPGKHSFGGFAGLRFQRFWSPRFRNRFNKTSDGQCLVIFKIVPENLNYPVAKTTKGRRRKLETVEAPLRRWKKVQPGHCKTPKISTYY